MKKENAVNFEMSQESLENVSLNKSFQERSDIALEVISRKPDFLEKWGLFIFLGILVFLLIGTWFVRYPDIIEGRAILTGENAPKEIIAKQSGNLVALMTKNGQQVKRGDIIGLIESTALADEVLDLSERLNESIKLLSENESFQVSKQFEKQFTNLGELQEAYQIFIVAWQIYNDYLVNGFYNKRKGMLNGDIAALESIRDRTSEQKELFQKESELAKKTFEMNEILYNRKVISAEEYRQAQGVLLNKLKAIPQADATVLSQQNLIRDKQKEIDQLGHDINQQQKRFEQALHTLKSQVDNWIRNYAIQAPADGTLVFVIPLQKNQHIAQGKLLGYVNPADTKFYAEVRLSQTNFGKIDSGMKVQLRLDAYPYQESGYVAGYLQYISSVTVDSGFLGIVKLDSGLVTNQNKRLSYKTGLKGKALIITKDSRLLERLYYSVVKSTSLNR